MALTVTSQRRPVELGRYVPVPASAAVAVLRHQPGRVIGGQLQVFLGDGEAYADLGVDVLGGRRIAREVRIGFGSLLDDEGILALPVWWDDAEHPELFPTFDGGVEVRPAAGGTELRLVGSYRPPFGALGRFADGLIGHRIVAASLEAFLAATAERLVAVAGGLPPAA